MAIDWDKIDKQMGSTSSSPTPKKSTGINWDTIDEQMNTATPVTTPKVNLPTPNAARSNEDISKALGNQLPWIAALKGLSGGYSFGVDNKLGKSTDLQNQISQVAQEKHPYISGVSNFVGSALNPVWSAAGVVSGLVGKGLKALGVGTGKIASNPIVQTAAREALTGAQVGAVEAGVQGKDIKDIAKNSATYGLMGGAMGGALKGIGAIANKYKRVPAPIEAPPPINVMPEPIPPRNIIPETPSVSNLMPDSIPREAPPILDRYGKPMERKFTANSVMNSQIATPELKQSLAANMPTYTPISNRTTWESAQARIAKDPEAAMTDFRSSNTLNSADDTALGEALIVKNIQEGNISEANILSVDLAERLTAAGQTVQAAAIFKRLTPEGMLMYANRSVNKAANEMKAKNPKKYAEADTATNDLKNSFDSENKKAVEEVLNKLKTPQEFLANDISSNIKNLYSTPNATIKEKELLKTLGKIAMDRLPNLPGSGKDPMRSVLLAVKDQQHYQDIWQKAKTILNEKYADDVDNLQYINDIFDTKLRPVFVDQKLNSAINKSLKDNGLKVSEIVKQHYDSNSKITKTLTQSLVDGAGLAPEQAKYLESFIITKVRDMTKASKEKQLASIFREKPSPDQKNITDKIIELSNLGAFQNAKYKDLIFEKLKLPNLSGEDAKFIITKMNDIKAMPEGEAKDIALAQVMQVIGDKIPSTISDKIKSYQRISTLLNPNTMGKNIAGNVINAGLSNLDNILATPIDKLVGAFTKKRTTTLPDFAGQIKSGAKGVKDTLRDYKMGIDTSPSRSQYELPSGKIWNPDDVNNKIGKLIYKGANWADKAVKTGLQMGDRPFYQAAYDDVIKQQLKLSGGREVTQEMKLLADDIAKQRTFQDDNGYTKAFDYIQRALNFGSEKFGLGNIVIPFKKTPANLLARTIEHTPMGAYKAIKELNNIRNGTFNQKKFVDSVSQSITGTAAIILLGYNKAKQGEATGAPPKDKDAASFQKQVGKLPYSFKIGDKYYTYDWAQPISMAIAMGADIYESNKNNKEVTNVVYDAIKSGAATLFKQSLLQGVTKFFGGANPVESMQDVILGAGTQFVPTILKQAATLIDNTARNTYSNDVLQKEAINPVINKLPIVNQKLPPKISTMGEEMKSYPTGNTPFNVLFNPARSANYKPTPIEKEIMRLYEASGETQQFPRLAPTDITFRNQTIQLTPQEITEYQKKLGEGVKKYFPQLLKSPTYASPSISDARKAQALSNIMTKVNNQIKQEILKSKGIIP